MTTNPQKIKARLNDVAADVRDVYQDAVCCINALQAELDDYKQAPGIRAEHYREKAAKAEAERDYWQKKFKALRDGPAIELAELRKKLATRAPRVITADELKEGMLVAIYETDTRRVDAGLVSRAEDGGAIVRLKGHGSTMFDLDRSEVDTIVLLADAPDEQQEPERLTVADLHAAPPGSELVRDDREFPAFKQTDGSWLCQPLGKGKGASMEFILAAGWDTATLTHPAPAPVTAETIRESEPGSTFEDKDGNVWEWDGEHLRGHSRYSKQYGVWAYLPVDTFVAEEGPLTRSTAAPRGDYGKVEVPNKPGELIAVTEFDGFYDAVNPIPAYLHEGDWYRLDGEPWPDHGNEGSYREARADQITGWKPAKVVTDE